MTMLDWITAHPGIAFCLSWPTALVLVSIAWSAATIITGSMTSVVNLISAMGSLAVILVRGHAPVAATEPSDET